MASFLSEEDIAIVLRKSQDLIYRMPGVIGAFSNSNPLTISSISDKGLIFIWGNKDTGVTHIMERHEYYSNRADWYLDENNQTQIDNPSKFSKNSQPLSDFKAISDEIFKPENKKESKYNLFEKYSGVSSRIENMEMEYHLILYKNTKIVHTLFPQKKTFNKRKKILNFKRGDLKVVTKPDERFLIANYPYFDANRTVRYIIILRLDNQTKILKTFVQINNIEGQPLYSEQLAQTILPNAMQPKQYFYSVENVDLSKVEKAIVKFDKQIFKE